MPGFVFKIKLQGGGRSGKVAVIHPPIDVKKAFGTTGRVPVRGTINGFRFRTSLFNMGGPHFMVVNQTMRRGAGGVGPGDTVRIVLDRDDQPRTIAAPADLKKALSTKPVLKTKWESWSYTRKKEVVLALKAAKKPETRARRVQKALRELGGGK